jgi:hypothetical protein
VETSGRRRGRWKLLLMSAVATLVLLEVVMQASSFTLWLADRRPAPVVEEGRDVVLCVGDSWTHGTGRRTTYRAR